MSWVPTLAEWTPNVGTWVGALVVILLLFYALPGGKIRFVATPRECAPEHNIFLLSMLFVEIRFSWWKVVTRGKL